jgi:hypothetical protein
LDHGADPNVKGYQGKTARELAEHLKRMEILKMLPEN